MHSSVTKGCVAGYETGALWVCTIGPLIHSTFVFGQQIQDVRHQMIMDGKDLYH